MELKFNMVSKQQVSKVEILDWQKGFVRLFFYCEGFNQILDRMSSDLILEDKLDRASNFSPWKERIMLILEVNDLLELTKPIVTPSTDATQLVKHNKKYAKARMLILDVVRDHIIPHLLWKKSTKEMWEDLPKLY